jgi:proline racemase
METDILVESLDTHTAGEPTRILTNGFDVSVLAESDVEASRNAFKKEYDWLRRFLVQEPRGHSDMFGAVPVFNTGETSDFGLFFFDNQGYLDMCGHGTIGAVTALIETGQIPEQTEYKIETPSGIVTAEPTVTDDRVQSVQIDNVPSYVLGSIVIDLPNVGSVNVDLVYSGNVVALVDAAQFEFRVDRADLETIREYGSTLKKALNAKEILSKSRSPITSISLVEFYEQRPDIDRNVVVFANGSIDRSPCGTGTCAKITLLHDEGTLSEGEPYQYESILGGIFTGIIKNVEQGDKGTVIHPTVSGRASITGKHMFVRTPDDELDGFQMRH